MSQDLTKYEPPPAVPAERSIEEVVAQAEKIKLAMTRAMEVDQHYGIIPGARKPSLWKPGAEKLCLLFRLDPQYHSEAVAPDAGVGGHLTVKSVCTLYHIPTGQRFGSGEASCSTRESKYAYRVQKRVCPKCHKETIIKGKAEYGGGWLCWRKEGKSDGCGAKFKDGDTVIESQETGRVTNEDLADSYNTVLKMANKRALVAGILNVTAASDVFTQDLEDFAREEAEEVPPVRRAPKAADGSIETPRRPAAPAGEAEKMTEYERQAAAIEDAPLDVQLERSIWLEKILKLEEQLGYMGKTRTDLWSHHIGKGVAEREAPLEKLADFEAFLRGLAGGTA